MRRQEGKKIEYGGDEKGREEVEWLEKGIRGFGSPPSGWRRRR